MRNKIFTLAVVAVSTATISSCGVSIGAGGTDTGVGVHATEHKSEKNCRTRLVLLALSMVATSL